MDNYKLTKQGVRDLGSEPHKPKLTIPKNCDHKNMTDCCAGGCGHYTCSCGEYWDDGFSGPFEEEFEKYEEDYLDVDFK